MKMLAVLLRAVLLIGSMALAFVLVFSGVYGYEEVAGEHGGWPEDVDAWQWDLVLVLGLLGLGTGAAAALRPTMVALALHAAGTGLGVAFVVDAGVVSREQLVLGWLATIAAGGALLVLPSRVGVSRS
jgi:hypothetical protein